MKRTIKFRRIIKFRAQRLDNRKWVYGDLEYIPGKQLARIHSYDTKGNYEGQHIVNPESVCQFTGLRDIAGNEIYEGDVLDTKVNNYVPNGYSFICQWIDSGFALIYQGRTYGVKEQNNYFNKYPLCQRNVEDLLIVGNIYDNPELIKKDSNEPK